MGSVLSEEVCPKCKYEFAFSDLYYKSGEEYFFCERCGYNYKVIRIIDKPKTIKIYEQVKKLLSEGKVEEAHREAGIKYSITDQNGKTTSSENVDILRKEADVKDFLKRIEDYKFRYIFKETKKGKPMFRKTEKTPTGVTKVSGVKLGVTSVGTYKNINKFKKWADKHKKDIGEATYTRKEKRTWYLIDILTGKKKKFPKKGFNSK